MDIRITFDGGVDPNPGAGYGSFLIERLDGPGRTKRHVVFDWLPMLTNNQAEYLTLIEALHTLPPLRSRARIELVGDSRLVLNQIEGSWHVNDPLLACLHRAAWALVQPHDVRCRWVPRDHMVEMFGH